MRRRIAGLVALAGLALVGAQLMRAWPRSQEVVYELGAGASALEVDYLKENEAVTSVRFRELGDDTRVIRHTVRLQPGTYGVRFAVYGPAGGVLEGLRTLAVPAEGVPRFDLKKAQAGSE